MSDVLVLGTVKEAIEIAHTAQDTILQIWMDQAESDVEEFLGYKLASSSRTENLDGGDYGLKPLSRPVTAVTSVTDSVNGNVIGSGDYRLESDAIYLEDSSRWLGSLVGRWTVVYTGGWTDATRPSKIDGVLYDLIYRIFHNRGGKSSQSSGGYNVNWGGNDSDLAKRLRRYRHGGTIIG